MERFKGQKFNQHRQEETRGQDKAKEKIKDYDQIDGFFDKQKTTKGKNYNLKRLKTATNLRLHNHQVAFLRRSSQRFRQLSVLDSFEVHTGKNITNKGIEPLWVWKCQLGKRVDTDSLHHKACFHFGIYCVEGKEIRRLEEDDNFRIQLGEEQGYYSGTIFLCQEH